MRWRAALGDWLGISLTWRGVSRRFGRCALVGNAQRMLLRESGSEIDGHDVVLRLNNAPTVGFERWVGSKTHLRLVNNQWTREYGLQESLPLEINCTLLISRADAQSVRSILTRLPQASFCCFSLSLLEFIYSSARCVEQWRCWVDDHGAMFLTRLMWTASCAGWLT